MRKGFTLIELLAVIVILAIIALIAVPIVLNIIDDSKESSLLRSAEFYLDAVEYTIADAFLYHGGLEDKTYPITPEGDICKVALVDNKCPMDGDKSNTLVVEVNGDKPTGGTITIGGGTVEFADISLSEERIIQNSKGKMIYFPCTLVEDTGDVGITPGDKYTCEVKEGTEYTFYVLNISNDGTTNLIMNSNICEDGSLPTDNKSCYYYWGVSNANFAEDYVYGPQTSLQKINEATKSWENLKKIKVNTFEVCDENGSNCEIKSMDGYEGYARLPYVYEINAYNSSTHAYAYLYDNMYLYCRDQSGKVVEDCSSAYYVDGLYEAGITHVNSVFGYWLMGVENVYYGALCTTPSGNVTNTSWGDSRGIRPVINIKL